MNLPRARILRGAAGTPIEAAGSEPGAQRGSTRAVRREVIDGAAEAARLLDVAREQAREIVEGARAEAAEQLARAVQRAREQAQAQASAALTAVRVREARADEAASERIIQIARLLAERVLHAQLRMAPEMLAAMAREAVAQFWQPQSVTVRACSVDVEVLRAHADELGVPPSALQFVSDDACSPGSIKVVTEQGALDTDVSMQLDRLVEALRH